jgi:hypothetical protein
MRPSWLRSNSDRRHTLVEAAEREIETVTVDEARALRGDEAVGAWRARAAPSKQRLHPKPRRCKSYWNNSR